MKVARDIIETMEALLRYLGLRLLVIAIKTCEELILQTHGDYIETQWLWNCISGGWSFIIIYWTLELLMTWYFKITPKKKRGKTDECDSFQN